MKTQYDIVEDIKSRMTSLLQYVNGGIYSEGHRPKDSDKEDFVVIHTAGQAAQVQTGLLTVHCYVKDVRPLRNGVGRENTERCKYISKVMQEWMDGIKPTGDIQYEQSGVLSCITDHETSHHILVLQIRYKSIN